MILQYLKGVKEGYSETDFISFDEIDLSGIEKEASKILEEITNQYGSSSDVTFIDMDSLFKTGKIKDTEKVKIATLSDAKEVNNNRVLLFSGETKLYLLNSNGKTIKKF